jgi:O-antigen/teichoic acid export membrane protein
MADNQTNESSSSQSNSKERFTTQSSRNFIAPSIMLFLDQLLIGIGGWVYWFVIPKFTNAGEIGNATTMYSLTIIISTLTQLGLEYPLLKQTQNNRSRMFGTALSIEVAITVSTLPLIFYMANSYGFSDLLWMAVGLIILGPFSFVSRFLLLGVSDSKTVLIYDTIGIFVKFVAGVALVYSGYGAVGILFSFVLSMLVTTAGTLFMSTRKVTLKMGDRMFTKEIVKEGVLNIPSKLSRMFIISLSVLLLASYGIVSEETGVFYISVMITIAVAGFATSMAFMSIPAASTSKADLTSGSLRLGLTYTAPLVALLLVAPGSVLSIIGPEYIPGSNILFVLAAGILPSVVVSNIVSKLNTARMHKKLVFVGSFQLSIFLGLFLYLVPTHGSLGASYAITISSFAASGLAFMWLERASRIHTLVTAVSISIASIMCIFISSILDLPPIAMIAAAVAISLSILFKLRNTSVKETKHLIQSLRGK